MLIITIVCLIYYLPILINPEIFLNRGNDLTEFFWPIYYFVKEQILTNHQLPFWNNLILSGTPLLPDPQAPFFYIPNAIFLLLPIGPGFIFSIFFHTLFGGIGAYLVSLKGFNLKRSTSIFAGIIYILFPKLIGYLEAGHFGLVTSWAWLPWVVLFGLLLIKKPKIIWSILLAISLSSIFYTHTTTFVYTVGAFSIMFILSLFKTKNLKSILYFILTITLTFGLTAIVFLPQIAWIPETNRYLLLKNPQVYPNWNSYKEFLISVFLPYNPLIDSEKWLAIGIIPSFLALYGFKYLKKGYKLLIIPVALVVILISLNNISPIYQLLMSQKWYLFARVSTRLWFIISLTTVFLAAYGYEKLAEHRKLSKIIIFLTICELLIISWVHLSKPIVLPDKAPKGVYEYLRKDQSLFRVYCTTRCLTQKESTVYGLELIDGYSTLIQKNYDSHALQLTGGQWNYYTLSIPPIGDYTKGKLHPNIKSLGQYNTKYIISPYEIEDINLVLDTKIDKYLIYKNTLFEPRSPAPIIKYSPNEIKIDVSNYKKDSIIISEVYNSDWKAYLDGKEVKIQETPSALRSIGLKPESQILDLKYESDSYKLGKKITLITIFILAAWILYRLFNNQIITKN